MCCCAPLLYLSGDVSKARYIRNAREIAEQATEEMGMDGHDHYQVKAKLAILGKQWDVAEGS